MPGTRGGFSDGRLLRTQTSALVPGALRALSAGEVDDVLLVCPGLTWRRDRVDRLHCGEPHQVDLWRIGKRPMDLDEMIRLVGEAALPGVELRTVEARHPYTSGGRQLDARNGAGWVEIGECGHASRALLARQGLAAQHGLAMGLGLDRLLMLRTGVDDIRLLRSLELLDLARWKPPPKHRAVTRDISLAVDCDVTAELLGDCVRALPGAEAVESVEVVSETPGEQLSEVARGRLGLREGQKNVLVRLTLRRADRPLTREEANALTAHATRALRDVGGASPGESIA